MKWRRFFSQIRERVEILTPEGKLLGYFEPEATTEEQLNEPGKESIDLGSQQSEGAKRV